MDKVDELTAELTGSFVTKLQEQISKQVQADVGRKIAQIDLTKAINEAVTRELAGLIKNVSFPDGSIPGPAVSLQNFLITGDNVVGGIVKNFGSTGIQDNATNCQVTILDEATVVENKLVVSELEVHGDFTLNGNFITAGELQKKLENQVASGVSSELASINIPKTVQDLASRSADSYLSSLQAHIKHDIDQVTADINIPGVIRSVAVAQTEQLVKTLTGQITNQVQADIARLIGMIDVKQQVREYVSQNLAGMIQTVDFPERSIPGQALNIDKFIITGDNISGGIVENFGSTGIQDNATSCQVTILDESTVFENTLVAAGAEIKGNLVVDGDIILTGEIPSNSPFYQDLVQHAAGLLKLSMDGEFFANYATAVFEKAKKEGMDVSRLTLNEKEVVSGNRLGRFITDSNIQRLGELRSLFVRGESSLANTLHVTEKRVGINTQEPSSALAVWDAECEVITKKLRQNVAVIGSLREQRVVLSANSKENLTLEIDGSVTIDRLNIGASQLGSTSDRPTHDEKMGVILFNARPAIGLPMFWMSLGGARWTDGPKVS